MSNLTVGKIVNNSLTLVLNSNDGDRETGKGTVNFTSKLPIASNPGLLVVTVAAHLPRLA